MKFFAHTIHSRGQKLLAGYITVDQGGWLTTTGNVDAATQFEFHTDAKRPYLTVASGTWKSSYLGFNAQDPYVCATNNWSLNATYVRLEARNGHDLSIDDFKRGAPGRIISDNDFGPLGKFQWCLEEIKGQVWLTAHGGTAKDTLIKRASGEPARETSYVLFCKKFDAREELIERATKTSVRVLSNEIDIEAAFSVAKKAEMSIDAVVEGGQNKTSTSTDMSGSVKVNYKDKNEKTETTENEVSRTITIDPGTVGWARVQRYELDGVVLDVLQEVEYVKFGSSPVMDRHALVMLEPGGRVMPWEEAKQRIPDWPKD